MVDCPVVADCFGNRTSLFDQRKEERLMEIYIISFLYIMGAINVSLNYVNNFNMVSKPYLSLLLILTWPIVTLVDTLSLGWQISKQILKRRM